MSKSLPKTLRFNINWKVTLFSILLMPVLLSLGIWQLDRAQEKQTILKEWDKQQALPPLKLTDVNEAFTELKHQQSNDTLETEHLDQTFRRIRFFGRFDDSKFWLIEGKTYQGKVGYHVVMAVQLQDSYLDEPVDSDSLIDKWVLVNRGWIESGVYRDEQPVFTTPAGIVEIRGNLILPSQALFVESKASQTRDWPKKVLDIQTHRMSQEYEKVFLDKVVQIDPENVYALAAFWPRVNIMPEKHHAYAFQWFAMAFALFILWLYANSNFFNWLKSKTK